jgi:hypothetical protein
MRYGILVALSGVWLAAQGQPNCTGVALDVDARCACIKFPNSDPCALVKSGLYEHLEHPDWTKLKTMNSGLVGNIAPPPARTAVIDIVHPGARHAARNLDLSGPLRQTVHHAAGRRNRDDPSALAHFHGFHEPSQTAI